MPQKLQYNTSVEKSLDNLRAMGLKVHVLPEGDNEVYIFIDLQSLLNLISRRIVYPNKKVTLDSGMVVVNLWRA